ncbi:class I SAM-dependent methyltransferase, partial [Leucobacter sp. M11]|uniref:class I SAM-dependent methyltransferase n=1 Tax=Leucobacter sp. M11 TaxID=2993565 RepID=UPI002D81135B
MTRPETASKSSSLVSAMFDEVSPRYDLANDVLSVGNSRLWRIAATRAVAPRKGMKVLDIAAGTGTSSAAFAAAGARVTAADFSHGMLAQGRIRQAGNERIEFIWADATDLPFPDNSFDATTISFGLRNVDRPQVAIAEMFRVTKPGGRVVICEFSRPPAALIREPYFAYTKHVLPRIAGLINGSSEAYSYLNDSIQDWPNQEQLAAWLREAGFERVAYRNLTLGIVALHRGFVPAEQPVAEAAPEQHPPAAKAPAAKRAEPKQAEPKKAEPKQTEPKQAEPKKAQPKSAAPQGADSKAAEAKPATAKPASAKPAAAKAAAAKPAAKPASAAKPAATKTPAAKAPAAKAPAAKTPATKPR